MRAMGREGFAIKTQGQRVATMQERQAAKQQEREARKQERKESMTGGEQAGAREGETDRD